MHLREWTYRELAVRLRRAGFQRIQVPFGVPDRIPAPDRLRGRPSTGYLAWVVAVERLLGALSRRHQKLVASRLLRNPLFPRELTMIAIKG
jgi:hypothetical protein